MEWTVGGVALEMVFAISLAFVRKEQAFEVCFCSETSGKKSLNRVPILTLSSTKRSFPDGRVGAYAVPLPALSHTGTSGYCLPNCRSSVNSVSKEPDLDDLQVVTGQDRCCYTTASEAPFSAKKETKDTVNLSKITHLRNVTQVVTAPDVGNGNNFQETVILS